MAGTRQTNTFVEVLQSFLVDVAKAKLIPDADMEFLATMEEMIIGRAKDAFLGEQASGLENAMGGAGPGGQGGPPGGDLEAALAATAGGGGMPPGMPPGMGQAMPVMPGGPPPGVPPLPNQPPPEELERLLRGTQ